MAKPAEVSADLTARSTSQISCSVWLLTGSLSMCAARPTTGTALTLFEFFLGPTNPPLACHLLFGVIDPANELIASERRDVPPRIEGGIVRDERATQIGREFMDHATRYPLSAHLSRLTALQGELGVLTASQRCAVSRARRRVPIRAAVSTE
jgi:hypothetical protein